MIRWALIFLLLCVPCNAMRYLKCPRCFDVAYYMNDEAIVTRNMPVFASDFLTTEGKEVLAGDRVRCGTCGNVDGDFFQMYRIKEDDALGGTRSRMIAGPTCTIRITR